MKRAENDSLKQTAREENANLYRLTTAQIAARDSFININIFVS